MSEWIELPDASTGKIYYANMKTKAKAWKIPKGFVTDEHIVKEGYLQKRSMHVKAFRKRWIVLKEHCLYSYKTPQKKEIPTEMIPLTSFTFIQQSNRKNKKPAQFELIISKMHQMTKIRTEKTRVFIAPSIDEMNSWISCIEKAFVDQNTKENKITKINHIKPKKPTSQKTKDDNFTGRRINFFKSMGAKLRCGTSKLDSKAQIEQDMDCYDYYISTSREQVKEWLNDIALSEYYENFMQNGFDTLQIIKTNLRNNAAMLQTIGITKMGHQMVIIKSIEKLYNNEQNETMISTSMDHITKNNEPLLPVTSQLCLININKQRNDCLSRTWKCDECYNVNSDQISTCLKCDENKYNTKINKKWLKKAVNV